MSRRFAVALLAVVFAAVACDDEPAPTAPPQTNAPLRAPASAPEPVSSDPGLAPLATRVLRGEATDADRAKLQAKDGDAVAAVIAGAAASDPATMGRVMQDLTALGAAALPGLEKALGSTDVYQRRIAVKVLMELRRTAEPLAPQLAAARKDSDPAVAAGAEIAWKLATGDTTDLDRARAEHEAAEARRSR